MGSRQRAKPGSRWRILARDGEREVSAQDDGVFDELVIDDWLHIEQMDDNTWWMRVADARIDIRVLPNGQAEVAIERDVYEASPA
jgi:hypothetical protein